MSVFRLKPADFQKILEDDKSLTIVKKAPFDSFNEDILGLGKLDNKSTSVNALSVIFDLEGFTNFCRQIDPQLAVPEFLNEFLTWIFSQIKKELIEKTFPEGYKTYSDFPFFSKYLGDGLLFLWDTAKMSDVEIANAIASMHEICKNYSSQLLPKLKKYIVSPPSKLRCGIARGLVYSVGNGSDFVGPCINMSARLQKLHSLSFCFSRRGLALRHFGLTYQDDFVVKKVDVRGIGSDELVCVLKHEFEALDESDKEKFLST